MGKNNSKSLPNVASGTSSLATNVTIEDSKGPDVKGKDSSTVRIIERIEMSGDNSDNFSRDFTRSKNSDDTDPLLTVVVDVPGDNNTIKDSFHASGKEKTKRRVAFIKTLVFEWIRTMKIAYASTL